MKDPHGAYSVEAKRDTDGRDVAAIRSVCSCLESKPDRRVPTDRTKLDNKTNTIHRHVVTLPVTALYII
jgi:hypothetical protein